MIRLILPIALLATACSPMDRDQAQIPPAERGKCHGGDLQSLVGKKRSASIDARAQALSGATRIRWVKPGMAVTMDYREDRLTVHLDDKGIITGAKCG